MTPNELADALSDEAMLASKRAQVLRALDYRDEAAILRDTVADELDRQSVRLMRMFAMALPDDPSAEPAGDVDWNAAIEAAANEADHWQSRSGSGHECGSCIAGAIRRLARSQRQCGCGLDTCKESWEPGCGLGTSIEHAVPVEPQRQPKCPACGETVQFECIACSEHNYPEQPQRQGRAVFKVSVRRVDAVSDFEVMMLEGGRLLPDGTYDLYTEQPASERQGRAVSCYRLHGGVGPTDWVDGAPTDYMVEYANKEGFRIEYAYTEQPTSAAAAVLIEIRELLASKPVDCLGSGVLDYGQTYPIRDEVIDRITKVLAAAPDRSEVP